MWSAPCPGKTHGADDWAHWLRLKQAMPGYSPDPLQALNEEEKRVPNRGWVNLLMAVVYQEMGGRVASNRELELAWQRIPSQFARKQYLDLLAELFPKFSAGTTA